MTLFFSRRPAWRRAVSRTALSARVMLVVVFLLVCASSAAEARPPTASAEVEPRTATVGDRLTLRLTLERDADTTVDGPDVADAVAPIAVLSMAAAPSRELDGRVIEDTYYVIAAFEPGPTGIPQLPFAYRTASGESGVAWTDSLAVTIESVIPDTLEQGELGPRDIKPPIELPRRIWPFLLAAIVAAACLVGLYYLRRWWRAREKAPAEDEPDEPVVPRRAAHLVALERLRELERDDPIGRADIVGFYVRVTEILRLYVRDRFGVDAIDMTTTELGPAMRSARMDEVDVDWTMGYLSRADLAKFAGHTPGAERARSDLAEAGAFVERTRFMGDEPEDTGDGPEDAGEEAGDAGEELREAGHESVGAGDEPGDAREEPGSAGEDLEDAESDEVEREREGKA